jgi:hypothetical protein
MRLPDERVELAVSKGPERPALRVVQFDRSRGILAASNGHIAAVVPIEEGVYSPDDETSKLDPEAILMARKELREEIAAADEADHEDLKKRGAIITCRPDGTTLSTGRFFPCPDDQLEFPDIGGLSLSRDPRDYDAVVSLNANLLATLAKAISRGGRVRLFVRRDQDALLVEPVPDVDADHKRDVARIPCGWIMPVRDEEMDEILGRKLAKRTEAPNGAEAGADA